ncbi:MAG: LytTR family transcriptional regulator DNA-binding domain-containing protein [Saprospiraceae bacterium]|nr:LytTR family transcriptional regulator DNA-binding domain-containing protein [Saprospiraceae bacterium]
MIDTIILQSENTNNNKILRLLETYCPKVNINQVVNLDTFTLDNLSEDESHMILYDVPNLSKLQYAVIEEMNAKKCHTILISPEKECKYYKHHTAICGVVHKPINEAEFVITVKNAIVNMELEQRINAIENKYKSIFPNDVIGIPTMEGFEYLHISDIIRCEGLQRCTRVVCTDRKDIISAYPIGQFRSLLQNYPFYLSHRSHLINLKKVVRYNREGFIFLKDSSRVPLARRNKADFISKWNHL